MISPFKTTFLLTILLLLLIDNHSSATTSNNPGDQIAVSIHMDGVLLPGESRNFSIDIQNNGQTAVSTFTIDLYLTPGLSIGLHAYPHEHYMPQWTKTVSLSPQEVKSWTLPVTASEGSTIWEGAALVYEGEIISRLTIQLAGSDNQNQPMDIAAPTADYNMPITPQVNCGVPAAPLSRIGNSALTALNDYYGSNVNYYSEYTTCNQFPSDWIYDVPNVIFETSPLTTDAQNFYEITAELLQKTEYIFTFSTLHFKTHDQSGKSNLVRHYLAPAILFLHQNTPETGPFPLVRFMYADQDPEHDTEEEVFNDLVFLLENEEPDRSKWRVSVAVATIGDIDIDTIAPSPWNHSKIAMRDYEEAISGGINWDLSYLLPETISSESPIQHPLYDLSMHIQGDAARAAGVYLDRLWRRTIDPLFPHLGNDCETSWPISVFWLNDCSLDMVPNYAPSNTIPNYSVSNASHVFSLGRGHTEWLPIGDSDISADVAIIAALNSAEETIYLSQHRLTSTFFVPLDFAPEIKEALVDAALRGVHVKIAVSSPWGWITLSDSPTDVYNSLIESLYAKAISSNNNYTQLDEALCRLQLGEFHLNYYAYPETDQHLFLNHSKFFVVDDKAFYIGSQNLYPSGIGSSSSDLIFDLNEHGYLVDDIGYTAEVLTNYWEPIWIKTGKLANLNQPGQLSNGYFCRDGMVIEAEKMFLPLINR